MDLSNYIGNEKLELEKVTQDEKPIISTKPETREVIVETWMFQITRYPNGVSYPGKMWQVSKKGKSPGKKSKRKNLPKAKEVKMEDVEEY